MMSRFNCDNVGVQKDIYMMQAALEQGTKNNKVDTTSSTAELEGQI